MARLLVALAPALVSARQPLRMPRWFGDNLVLQTNSEYGSRSFLNGMAEPFEHIDVTIGQATFPIVADSKGAWEIEANHASGDVTVQGEVDTLTAKGATSGDVFFCSGQSNMVFPMELAFNSSDEMATLTDYPNFRFFMTALDYDGETPLFDLRPDPSECDKTNASLCALKCNAPGSGMCNRWVTAAEAMANNNTYLKQFSAVCYMTVRDIARMHTGSRPAGLVFSAWGGTRVEAWMSTNAIADAATRVVPPSVVFPLPQHEQNNVSALYNAMVAPFNKLSIRAAFWYQGEANCHPTLDPKNKTKLLSTTTYYAQYLQAMVKDWRDLKGMGDFTFVAMMLPPSVPNSDPGTRQTFRPEVRLGEQQIVPHTVGLTDISGVAVTSDLGGASAWGFDHPPNKNEMARRLALQTVHAAYAVQGRVPHARGTAPGPDGTAGGTQTADTSSLWTGPVLESVIQLGESDVTVAFAGWSAAGLVLKDVKALNINGSSNSCLKCCAEAPPFEIWAQSTAEWIVVPAHSITVDANAGTVTLTAVGKVIAVRYAFADYVDCVLVNNDSLPLAPFIANVTSTSDLSKVAAPQASAGSDPSPSSTVAIQSPPMGFNSWNFYHCNIDENIVKAMVDTFVANGMAAVNYTYINIDDCWQVAREPKTGAIIPDPVRFPSGMKALSDYAHSKSMHFGLYTARGSGTCQQRPGSLNYELIDAATYCAWEIDYIKIDACRGAEDPQTSWSRFHAGIEKCHNDTGHWIVQSVESCDTPDSGCGLFAPKLANLWRTGGDVQNFWGSIMNNIHKNDKMADVARPGHFNDPDMLQVGNVGLDADEQRSHFALWCIAGAPLLVGTDVIHATNLTLSILVAPELIMVNQDLGIGGKVQGKFLGPAAAAVPSTPPPSSSLASPALFAVMRACDGSPVEKWAMVDPVTGTQVDGTPTGPVKLQEKSTGGFLAVLNCGRAVLPYGVGPTVGVVNASAPSSCNGRDRLWTFHSNGTATTSVDGQCLNVRGGKQARLYMLQTFACGHAGHAGNGQFIATVAGAIVSEGRCVTSASSVAPGPGPAPPVSTGSELWSKPLSDGRTAVLLLNLDDTAPQDLTVSFTQVNRSGFLAVRDLRKRVNLGRFQGNYTARNVPPHGSVVLAIGM